MIYLKNTAAAQRIRIPLSGLEAGQQSPRLEIWSTTGNKAVYDLQWTDSQPDRGYALGTVRLPEGLPTGEYEYRLSEGQQTLSSGVAQVGDYKAVPQQKSNQTITFKQYGE